MFLTNQNSIKVFSDASKYSYVPILISPQEVLTFPFMKDVVEEKKTAAEVVGIEPKPEEGIGKQNHERFTTLSN
jgi:hypothetical protein